jgi:phosphatidate cytidylyltransferase
VLKQRVITAVVLLAVFLAAAAAGRTALNVVLAVLFGTAAYEWFRLARHPNAIALAACIVGAALLLGMESFGPWPPPGARMIFLVLAATAWALIAVLVVRGAQRGAGVTRGLSTALAVVLLAGAWFALMHLLDRGFVTLLSVLALVWVADIAAYFAGRKWGRRKLAPAISPGKTWAGVGGAVFAVWIAAMVCAVLAPNQPVFSTLLWRWQPILALAILTLLVAWSIVGDLFESLLKRQVGVKDSGWLLPGHGGVLDRVDAMIAVLPLAALLETGLRR